MVFFDIALILTKKTYIVRMHVIIKRAFVVPKNVVSSWKVNNCIFHDRRCPRARERRLGLRGAPARGRRRPLRGRRAAGRPPPVGRRQRPLGLRAGALIICDFWYMTEL